MVASDSKTVWRSVVFGSASPEYADNGIMSWVCHSEVVLNTMGGFMDIINARPNVVIVLYADLGYW